MVVVVVVVVVLVAVVVVVVVLLLLLLVLLAPQFCGAGSSYLLPSSKAAMVRSDLIIPIAEVLTLPYKPSSSQVLPI